MKDVVKRFIVLATTVLVLIMSVVPIQASVHKKEMKPQSTVAFSGNILANVSLSWDSFLHRFSFNDLDPKVSINQSAVRDFYFPEINGTIQQMNFTVIFRHKLDYRVILPRYTQFYLAIPYNDTYFLFLYESEKYRATTFEWEYHNFTVGPDDQLLPLETHGKNTTLTVEVGAYGNFFGLRGETEVLANITIHPIVM